MIDRAQVIVVPGAAFGLVSIAPGTPTVVTCNLCDARLEVALPKEGAVTVALQHEDGCAMVEVQAGMDRKERKEKVWELVERAISVVLAKQGMGDARRGFAESRKKGD